VFTARYELDHIKQKHLVFNGLITSIDMVKNRQIRRSGLLNFPGCYAMSNGI